MPDRSDLSAAAAAASGPHPVIVWFRQDLRLADNPALAAAVEIAAKAKAGGDGKGEDSGAAIIPVYIWAPHEEGDWPYGGASRWWLHHSLQALDEALHKLGSRLILRVAEEGPHKGTLAVLRDLIRQTGARTVLWNRRYEPAIITRDKEIKEQLRAGHPAVAAESFNGALLREPWTIKNKSGKPFQVFTPFWRHCLALEAPHDPVPAPSAKEMLDASPQEWPESAALSRLQLLPHVDWAARMAKAWAPGEAGGAAALDHFAAEALMDYTEQRNFPARTPAKPCATKGTSRLSPHLHFGEVSPRQVWHAVRRAAQARHIAEPLWTRWQYLTELGWREFSHHLIFHFPHTPAEPLREEFAVFPWLALPANALPGLAADTSNPKDKHHHLPEIERLTRLAAGETESKAEARRRYNAWTRGRTGYPLVDAGMRELWATGWMHNRVRMVVASFLVKHLLLSWQSGAHWFWDTLVDADLAQNTLGWQWTAGCGADAAPYFRVFNPVTQSEKFDAQAEYIRRWVPELKKLSDKHIHQPWEAPPELLRHAGITLGKDYPHPIVDHAEARKAALEAFEKLKNSG